MRAVLFDMDGVVVDSIEPDYAAWERIFAEHGKTLTFDIYKAFSGMKGRAIAMRYLDIPADESTAVETRKEEYFIENARHLTPLAGVERLISHLRERGVKIALVTASNTAKAKAMLGILKLSFDALVTADDTEKGKPDPAPFLLGAQRVGVPPAECIVIEDAPNGLLAARRGGMHAIGITTTHSRGELDADRVIDSFAELDDLFA